MARLTFANFWMGGCWHSDVTMDINEAGELVPAHEERSSGDRPSEYIKGLTLPGMASAHSHAFQRILPPWTQRAGSTADSFWTWRRAMYALASSMKLEDLEAIAARCFLDLLKGGYTGVAEFLYLHRLDTHADGAPDADLAIASAARRVGISLTLLPALYQHAGFGQAPARPEQRPFIRSTAQFLDDWRELEHRYADDPLLSIGLAFHSLRAVDIETIERIHAVAAADPACRALHIHVSEQPAEVADCMRHWNRTPIALLLERGLVDGRWTMVHGTHATSEELDGIRERGATLAVCPTTEADLGDGCVDATSFLQRGGRLAIGSDSNICCSALAELRLLEWSQRLRYRRRNLLASPVQPAVADALYETTLSCGWTSLGKPVSSDAKLRADFVTFDPDDGSWQEQPRENYLSFLVFACREPRARYAMAGGRWLIRDGVHEHDAQIDSAYRAALSRLSPTLIEAQNPPNQDGEHPC